MVTFAKIKKNFNISKIKVIIVKREQWKHETGRNKKYILWENKYLKTILTDKNTK